MPETSNNDVKRYKGKKQSQPRNTDLSKVTLINTPPTKKSSINAKTPPKQKKFESRNKNTENKSKDTKLNTTEKCNMIAVKHTRGGSNMIEGNKNKASIKTAGQETPELCNKKLTGIVHKNKINQQVDYSNVNFINSFFQLNLIKANENEYTGQLYLVDKDNYELGRKLYVKIFLFGRDALKPINLFIDTGSDLTICQINYIRRLLDQKTINKYKTNTQGTISSYTNNTISIFT